MGKQKQPEGLLPKTYSDTKSHTRLADRASVKLGFENRSAMIRHYLDIAIEDAGLKERES